MGKHTLSKTFNPSEYQYVTSYYIGSDDDLADWVAEMVYERNAENVDPFQVLGLLNDEPLPTRCAHCGTNFLYGAIYNHIPSGEAIAVGNRCADNTFALDSRRALDLKHMQRARLAAKTRAENAERARKYLEDKPELAKALEMNHDIAKSLNSWLQKRGSLTEKQIELALRLPGMIEAKKKQDAETRPVVPGRRVLTATVLSVRFREDNYGRTEHKMLILTDDKQKLWGTVPVSIYDVKTNEQITLTATVEVSKNDANFGFFKRPTKAEKG